MADKFETISADDVVLVSSVEGVDFDEVRITIDTGDEQTTTTLSARQAQKLGEALLAHARGERRARHTTGCYVQPVRLLWASPPCTAYSRESMPWCRTGTPPDPSLWLAAEAQIARLSPRWWVIENVRGAQTWRGRATLHLGPFYLWTNIPREAFASVPTTRAHWGAYKQRLSGKDRDRAGRERGAIPQVIASAVTLWAEAHP